MSTLHPHDQLYVAHSLRIMAEWVLSAGERHDVASAASLLGATRDQADTVLRILDGEPSPWRDFIPTDYLAVCGP